MRICQKLKRLELLRVKRRFKEGTDRLNTCAYELLKPWCGYVPESRDLNAPDKIQGPYPPNPQQQQQQQECAT